MSLSVLLNDRDPTGHITLTVSLSAAATSTKHRQNSHNRTVHSHLASSPEKLKHILENAFSMQNHVKLIGADGYMEYG